MNEEDAAAFLFSIAKEIKRSFESPVILVNKKDYAANIHKLLVEMRQSLIADAPPAQIVETVVGFHLEWLQAVRDLRGLKAKIKDTPREVFWSAIDYTIQCVKSRYLNFNRYIEHLQKSLTQKDRNLMQAEIELIEDMQKSVLVVLEEKRHFLQFQSDQSEFIVKVEFEIEELMNWLDRLNDNLVVQLCKVVAKEDPSLLAELSYTLKDIVEEVTSGPATGSLLSVLKKDPLSRQYMVRMSASHELEIKKVRDKINVLEDRIERLKGESSAAIMALQHKKIYLEERLRSLENMKESLKKINEASSDSLSDIDFLDRGREVHIFNHWLPIYGRYRLVEELVNLWKAAIHGTVARKSVISILSVADFKEIYDDDLGHFFIDKHGRKLYEKDNDGNLYQANEHNVLVPVSDDEHHAYFYDNCGRYYISATDQRIYQAHKDASEYIMHPLGYMLKHKEVVDGVTYWYDKLGRYYLNEDSRRIYREQGETTEYVHDGFGNLIPLHHEKEAHCSHETTKPMTSKDSLYLKRSVGDALKHCIRSAALRQPADPIAYLADALEKYWHDARANCEQRQDEVELLAERARLAAIEAEAATEPKQSSGEGSEGVSDSNFIFYNTKQAISPLDG